MTHFEPDPAALQHLQGSVIVLTGGAAGIGAATVRLLLNVGAKVVFGDFNISAAESLVSSLRELGVSATAGEGAHAELTFVHCDVAQYGDNLKLFRTAFEKYGRVDHAIANAGLVERPGWFEATLSIEDVQKEPDTAVLDVNLKGLLYFARIACVYLAHGETRDRSLTLLSSVAAFEESPGLFVYQASKHGVLGLLRALRLYTQQAFGVRVNAVCPSMTLTGMVSGISRDWLGAGLPTNTPEDIALVIAALVSAGPGRAQGLLRADTAEGDSGRHLPGAFNSSACMWSDQSQGLSGRAIYVEGGKGWEIEEGLAYTQPYWLGKSPCERLVKGQQVLGQGSNWTK